MRHAELSAGWKKVGVATILRVTPRLSGKMRWKIAWQGSPAPGICQLGRFRLGIHWLWELPPGPTSLNKLPSNAPTLHNGQPSAVRCRFEDSTALRQRARVKTYRSRKGVMLRSVADKPWFLQGMLSFCTRASKHCVVRSSSDLQGR